MNSNEKPQTENPTERIPEAQQPAAPQPERPARRSGRIALIAAGAVVALLAVGGGAYALGANAEDDADDDRRSSPQVAADRTDDSDAAQDDRGDDADDRSDDGSGQGTGSAAPGDPVDAAALRAAAEKAISETGAEGATSIDVERGGYEVEVRLLDGTEPDVFVAVDGTVTTGRDDDRDDSPDPLLDLGRLDAIADAALKAAASSAAADGVIDDISTSDDPGVAYEVSIRLSDDRDADVDLDAKLGVVTVDVDDD
jgi:uncharacterized membrane protein YkoI